MVCVTFKMGLVKNKEIIDSRKRRKIIGGDTSGFFRVLSERDPFSISAT